MKGLYKNEQKGEILKSCILPNTEIHWAQEWAMMKKEAERIKVILYAEERSILGVRLKNKIKMEHT